jgi:hypothetical protein
MPWSRDTKWTQGSVLIINERIKSCLRDTMNFDYAVVISHACDIAQDPDVEPMVEIIFGEVIEASNGNCEHGKNPRMLHLPIKHIDDDKTIELRASNKRVISKDILGEHEPDASFQLQLRGKKVLQSWLAARYRRHAFPDEFNERMKKIIDFIISEGKKHNRAIIGYWVNYEPERELSPDELYELDIYVVYSVDEIVFEEEAKEVVKKIAEKFNEKNLGIILGKCEAYAETEFTYHDMRNNYEYQLEYISLRYAAL